MINAGKSVGNILWKMRPSAVYESDDFRRIAQPPAADFNAMSLRHEFIILALVEIGGWHFQYARFRNEKGCNFSKSLTIIILLNCDSLKKNIFLKYVSTKLNKKI